MILTSNTAISLLLHVVTIPALFIAENTEPNYFYGSVASEGIDYGSTTEVYEIVLVNNYGEKVNNASISLDIMDKSDASFTDSNPRYINYKHQSDGRYIVSLDPAQLNNKEFKISVYDQNHFRQVLHFNLLPTKVKLELNRLRAPDEIINYFNLSSRSYNDPCSRGKDSLYNNGSYRLQITTKGPPAYVFWEVGCPATRGRGFMILFDGETKSYLGETFGYHVTGFFHLDDDSGIRVVPHRGNKYFDIVFNTTSSEYIFRYDESKDLYSLEVR